MALDNVVPIDAEAARHLARRNARFRWFVAMLTATWIGVLVPVLVYTPLPPLGPFIVLAVLVVLAEHRFVLFGDETSMSASIIVIVASVFVFADTSPLAGPMLIASLGGLYLPHLRRGRWALTAANAASFSVSVGIASSLCMSSPLAGNDPTLSALVASTLAACAYWYANSVLIGCATAARHGTNLSESVRSQAVSEWPVLCLATGSGLLAQTGATAGTICLGLALLLVVFEMQIRRCRSSRHSTQWASLVRVGMTAAVTATCATALTGLSGAAVATTGAFIVLSDTQFVKARMAGGLVALTIALGMAGVMDNVGVPTAILFTVTTLVAVAAVIAIEVRSQMHALGRKTELLSALGLLMPSRREVLLLALAAVAIQGSLAVFDAGVRGLAVCTAILLLTTRVTCLGSRPSSGSARLSAQRSSVSASR